VLEYLLIGGGFAFAAAIQPGHLQALSRSAQQAVSSDALGAAITRRARVPSTFFAAFGAAEPERGLVGGK